ncbi:MAG: hypothetical protein QE285_14720 [Aquabacterium sp.]|nr:hypothetical protein [Aquabacterium sp.]
MTALLLLLATAGASFGWQLADDKARAGTALAYLLALVLFAMLKGTGGRLLALVCTFGITAQAAGLACVVWYERLSSRDLGVCDEGTGLPIGLMFAAGLLVVAAEFLKGRQ